MPERLGLYPLSSTFNIPLSAVELSILIPDNPAHFTVLGNNILTASSASDSLSLARSRTAMEHHEVQTEIDRKNVELAHLRQEILKTQAQQATQEVQNCVQDENIAALRNEMERIKADIATLEAYEDESVKTLNAALENKKKEINVELGEKLTKVKEELAEEIETSATKSSQRHNVEAEELRTSINIINDKLNTQKTTSEKSESLELERKQIIEELHSKARKRLADIEGEMGTLKQRITQKNTVRGTLRVILNEEQQQSNLKRTADLLKKKQFEKDQQHVSLLKQIADIEFKIEHSKIATNRSAAAVRELEQHTQTFRESYASLEAERRILHNRLQELQGNIRVFCRVRPSLDSTVELAPMCIAAPEDVNEAGKQILTLASITRESDIGTLPSRVVSSRYGGNSRTPDYRFSFNKVFPPESDNSEIFSEISQLVQSSLDGFNVCIFAYGQTGSGKTWTMSHKEDGMIPLSINKIFSDIEELTEKGWQYTIDGQFVEIYNEQINDLLAMGRKDVKLDIKHDDIAKKTVITNCTTVSLKSRDHAFDILEKATRRRSTASTMSNIRSSRSHSAFIFNIRGIHESSGQSCEGTLNLIDLAGSERVNNSKVKDQRLKETQAINKSLSSLGNVIHGLGQRKNSSGHVPYRDSRLTYLLQHSLGGESKTLMFVNISPDAKNFNETLNSLRFATKVNDTKLC
ncbi:hypothetical protein JCM33374_g253 [Metschnikowia sp. JCM 33374]|nr:hypothetical protein JCM33374_g253 [Metschnikowia sp. JCM 33374]